MKFVGIESVEPGQYLGKTVFAGNGTVLLAEGVQLTVFMINTLRRIGVTMLYIKDPLFEDVVIEETVSEENKRVVLVLMNETMEAIRSGKDFGSKAVSVSVDRLLEDISSNKEVLLQLSDIRSKDNEMFVHALNVATMSALVGINMGYNQAQLKELTIGALLHDIGKAERITEDSMTDPKLHHAWRGFELLKTKREFSLLIAHIAFQHHETPDGLGVPRQLADEQIHEYAKIVAVANTFDNLLFGEDGKRVLPHNATERMMALAGTKLDREVLIQFLRIVSIYPTGTSVRLSTKESGVIVGQHRGLPGRPIVRVVKKAHSEDEEFEVKEVDLAKQPTVFIEAVLS
ncbi:HD-GYP domain-containing protein [Gorillibacterium massiliense]|uniref:HD-GYP domain-containing protein n=1 Tax=Gorillibacterium massiliense TaxID=1280390 RepID=UPI0004ADDD10|nr:HD domain-containing phosphohydrolase [Gorillibacterium massiliense]